MASLKNASTFPMKPFLTPIIYLVVSCFFFFLKDFIHLFESESFGGGRTEGEGEADFLLSREPNAGLDPRTLGP